MPDITFKWEIGPAFVMSCITAIGGFALAAVLWFGEQKSSGEATSKSLTEMKMEDVRHTQGIANNDRRLAVIESNLIDIKDTLRRIEARQFGEIYRVK